MPSELTKVEGAIANKAMEGGGFYNRNSTLQAAGIELVLPLFEDVLEAPDPFWDEFVETRDAGQFGRRWAGMLRAIGGPVAAEAFASRPNADLLVDELLRRLEASVAASPQRNQHFVAVALVSKT